MAGLGYERVRVYRASFGCAVEYGDELVPIGATLQPGKIRNSSIYTIASYLERWGRESIHAGN